MGLARCRKRERKGKRDFEPVSNVLEELQLTENRHEKAPQVGLEPTTLRLTAGCSAIELLRSNGTDGAVFADVTQRGYQSRKGWVNGRCAQAAARRPQRTGSGLRHDPIPPGVGLLNNAGNVFCQQISLRGEIIRCFRDAVEVVCFILVAFFN
jgi:hypothetical protein